VVVLGRDDHEGVRLGQSFSPLDHRRQGLARPDGRQVERREVDHVEVEIGMLGGHGGEPVGDGRGEAALTGAADDQREAQRCVSRCHAEDRMS
jgi:hypothetical protein